MNDVVQKGNPELVAAFQHSIITAISIGRWVSWSLVLYILISAPSARSYVLWIGTINGKPDSPSSPLFNLLFIWKEMGAFFPLYTLFYVKFKCSRSLSTVALFSGVARDCDRLWTGLSLYLRQSRFTRRRSLKWCGRGWVRCLWFSYILFDLLFYLIESQPACTLYCLSIPVVWCICSWTYLSLWIRKWSHFLISAFSFFPFQKFFPFQIQTTTATTFARSTWPTYALRLVVFLISTLTFFVFVLVLGMFLGWGFSLF